ncbi:adenosine deaminase [Aeromicrobium wangtongii]|uniref:Adenine deaminase n=1 Tax=Aeromicrobium wangtongii TaxID=2969247 RepID=A0ABY5M6V3_9ACTN|nr:adenosine deaminase [Aeromicrobium wangtongii]MCD9198480.1 adenosine deaminase [Aeromicrobium wangtongii]UUP12507.1 adenosine deaminase [Aeromicrobium wangtongii]
MHDLLTLPKAELHLHIEGTLEPELVFALARRNRLTVPFADVEALRTAYRFDDLVSFLDLYYACMDVLRTEEDFADLVTDYARRAAAQGVRHVEMFFDPQAHTSRGIPLDVVMAGLTEGIRRASALHDLSAGLIACFLRDRPVEEAHSTLDALAGHVDSLLGIGLDSAEVGYPPSLFTEVYRDARQMGLRLVAHAGEEGPPSYVWEAIDELGVDRVDHGVRVMEDSALVQRLQSDRMPLTLCPLSNVRLRVLPDLSFHPMQAMLSAGLVVTVNSDDPAYFGGYAGDNFVALAEDLPLGQDDFVLMARNSFDASFIDDDRRRELMTAVDEWRADADQDDQARGWASL